MADEYNTSDSFGTVDTGYPSTVNRAGDPYPSVDPDSESAKILEYAGLAPDDDYVVEAEIEDDEPKDDTKPSLDERVTKIEAALAAEGIVAVDQPVEVNRDPGLDLSDITSRVEHLENADAVVKLAERVATIDEALDRIEARIAAINEPVVEHKSRAHSLNDVYDRLAKHGLD